MLAFHHLTLESGPMTYRGYKEFDVPSSSPNFRTELSDKLAELAPEIIADGKLNINKLADLLNDDADSSSERFGLTWPGKRDAQRLAQMPTTATLLPDRDNSVDWDTTQNVFIEGDNLEVLKVLQKHYYGKIKMIYIDPPYNTGKDFVYKDDFRDGVANYLEWTEQTTDGGKLFSNTETAGRYHSNWLNMMYPRLKLARNLLADDGLIIVHCDEHEQANLEILLNQIYGETNKLGLITWDKRNPKGDSQKISQQNEFIFVYARNTKLFASSPSLQRKKPNSELMLKKAAKFIKNHGGVTPEARSEFKSWVSSQSYLTGGEAAYNDIDENGDVYRSVSMAWPNSNTAPDEYRIPLIHPTTKKKTPIPSKGWRNPPAKMKDLLDKGLIIFGTDETIQPTRKYLLRENLYEGISSVLPYGSSDSKLFQELDIPFDNPKPLFVVQQLVASATKDEQLILDFFAGSGTTAHAVMQLNAEDGGNRKCISVQLPEPTPENSSAREANFETIADISRERIRRAGKKILKDETAKLDNRAETLDVGFRAYKLADTNFAKWKVNATIDENELEDLFDSVRDSANDVSSPEELFTETILKLGLSLTEQYEQKELAGLTVFSVDHDLILGYFDEKIKPNLDQLSELVELAEVRLIVLEDAFQGDDELKTNLVQLCKTRDIDLSIA